MAYHVVFYLRLSSEDLDHTDKEESNSITNQKKLIQDYVNNDPFFIGAKITVLADDGYTGTNFNRPAMVELANLVENKLVNCVIVKDFSRLGRNELITTDYIDQIFPRNNVRFIAVNEGYDSENHKGKTSDISVIFRQIINAYHSKDLSKKIKSSLKTKARTGEYLSAYAPIGYQKSKDNPKKLEVEPVSAEIVKYIFLLAGTGLSTTEIAKKLNSEKIETRSTLKNNSGVPRLWKMVSGEIYWNDNAVLQILKDERYLGKVIYGKRTRKEIAKDGTKATPKEDWIVVENTHESLVTEDEFEKIQKSLRTLDNTYRKKNVHLFTKKLKCGICNHVLIRKKKKQPSYHCQEPKFNPSLKCTRLEITEEEVASVVFKILQQYLEIYLEQIKRPKPKATEIQNLKKKGTLIEIAIKNYEQKKILLYEKYVEEEISSENYHTQRASLDDELKSIKSQLSDVEKMIEKQSNEDTSPLPKPAVLKGYLSATTLDREMVETFIDCIYVYPDRRIKIDWKFKDSLLTS